MTRIRYLLYGVGLVALQACSSSAVTEDVAESQAALTCTDTPRPSETCANAKAWGFCGQSWFSGYCQVTCGQCTAGTGGSSSTGGTAATGGAASSSQSQGNATLSITSSDSGQYCANVTMTNGLAKATTKWRVALDLKTSRITSSWSGSFSGSTGSIMVSPTSSNPSINPGSNASFGWCASIPNSTIRPALQAWNFEMDVYQTCQSNNGNFPALAALAVAMGKELGRWKPNVDLVRTGMNVVGLSSTGLAQCTNGCPNTKALLGQATASASWTSNVFDPVVFGSYLWNAFANQTALLTYLQGSHPAQLPPEHKLTLVAGPVDMGIGACGPHYLFQVDNVNGTPMTSTQAANMANSLCYFGMNSPSGFGCGGNPYLGFFQTSNGCPSGRTCIAIDPTDGDNGTISSTSSGSAVTYPMNRVYDPTNSLLGSVCITTVGKLGKMTSKCAAYPQTCGYLYCVAK